MSAVAIAAASSSSSVSHEDVPQQKEPAAHEQRQGAIPTGHGDKL
jgi:hypothetical protein